jgi:RNA polymerase sigma factor (sigma-70 family)
MSIRSTAVLHGSPDARLVERARAGDPDAFTAIVARYRRPLLRYCTRYVARDRAEDVVQETFASAFLALGRSNGAINLRPWLYRIAHNAAVSTLRRGGPSLEPLREDHVSGEPPADSFERSERLRATVAQIRDLPDQQRTALLWHVAEGRSYQTIASAMMISPGAAQQLVHRARTRLRAALGAVMPTAMTGRIAALVGSLTERVPGGGRAIAGVSGALLAAGTIAVVASVPSTPPADASRVASDSTAAPALPAGVLLPIALEHRTRALAHVRPHDAARRAVRRRARHSSHGALGHVASTPAPRAPSTAPHATSPAASRPAVGSTPAPRPATPAAAAGGEEDAPDKVDRGAADGSGTLAASPTPAASPAPAMGDAPEAGDSGGGG